MKPQQVTSTIQVPTINQGSIKTKYVCEIKEKMLCHIHAGIYSSKLFVDVEIFNERQETIPPNLNSEVLKTIRVHS